MGFFDSFSKWFSGSKGKMKQAPTLPKDFMEALRQIIGGGGRPEGALYGAGEEYLRKMLSGEGFEEFEAPLMRQFSEQIVPGVAERFAGVGGLSSSGFQQALGEAASGLTERLGAQRAGLTSRMLPTALQWEQQPMSNLLQAIGLGRQQPYYQEGSPGMGQQLMQIALPLLLGMI